MTNSITTHGQIQALGLAQPNIYSIYELLVNMKMLVLQIQKYRISMTQGNNRVSEKGPREGPVFIVHQKPEASDQTMTHCTE